MRTRSVIITGMFAAVLTVLSQISIPFPSGVPVTLQTFAVALIAYVLGCKKGIRVLLIYILLGAVGVPVFAGFRAGVGQLVGLTGGFIWGFFFLVLSCGYGRKNGNKLWICFYSAIGLLICHVLGICQFMLVMEMGFVDSALLVSLPYILKDALSVFGAYMLAGTIRKALYAAGEF